MKSELNNFLVSIQLNPISEFNAVYSMLQSNLYLLLIVLFSIRWHWMETLSSLLIVFEWHLPNATLLNIFRHQFLFVAATSYCQLNRFGIQAGIAIFNKAKCRSICLDDLNYYLFVFVVKLSSFIRFIFYLMYGMCCVSRSAIYSKESFLFIAI